MSQDIRSLIREEVKKAIEEFMRKIEERVRGPFDAKTISRLKWYASEDAWQLYHGKKTELENTIERALRALSTADEALRKAVNALNVIATIQEKIRMLSSKVSSLSKEISRLTELSSNLSSVVESITKRVKASEEELKKLSSVTKKISDSVSLLDSRVRGLWDDLRSVTERLSSLEERAGELKKRIDDAFDHVERRALELRNYVDLTASKLRAESEELVNRMKTTIENWVGETWEKSWKPTIFDAIVSKAEEVERSISSWVLEKWNNEWWPYISDAIGSAVTDAKTTIENWVQRMWTEEWRPLLERYIYTVQGFGEGVAYAVRERVLDYFNDILSKWENEWKPYIVGSVQSWYSYLHGYAEGISYGLYSRIQHFLDVTGFLEFTREYVARLLNFVEKIRDKISELTNTWSYVFSEIKEASSDFVYAVNNRFKSSLQELKSSYEALIHLIGAAPDDVDWDAIVADNPYQALQNLYPIVYGKSPSQEALEHMVAATAEGAIAGNPFYGLILDVMTGKVTKVKGLLGLLFLRTYFEKCEDKCWGGVIDYIDILGVKVPIVRPDRITSALWFKQAQAYTYMCMIASIPGLASKAFKKTSESVLDSYNALSRIVDDIKDYLNALGSAVHTLYESLLDLFSLTEDEKEKYKQVAWKKPTKFIKVSGTSYKKLPLKAPVIGKAGAMKLLSPRTRLALKLGLTDDRKGFYIANIKDGTLKKKLLVKFGTDGKISTMEYSSNGTTTKVSWTRTGVIQQKFEQLEML